MSYHQSQFLLIHLSFGATLVAADPKEDDLLQLAGCVREKAKKAKVTLDISKQPVQVIMKEISEKSSVAVDYVVPAKEPVLSVKIKNGTVFEVLEYVAL